MPYREDLEAALAHADAAERQLEEARKENEADHARIAELEGQLAAAKRGVHETKQREPTPPSAKRDPAKDFTQTNGFIVLIFVGVAAVMGLTGLGIRQCMTAGSKSVVDVSRDRDSAEVEARRTLPDPVLSEISADFVNPEGLVDLVAYYSRVSYSFVSPSRSGVPAPASSGPVGAPAPTVQYDYCSVSIRYSQDRVTSNPIATCGEPLQGPPSCTVVEVWNEAIRRGAPSNAVASIRLDMGDVKLPKETTYRHMPVWRFSIAATTGPFDPPKALVDYTIPDKCPIMH